MCVTRRFHVHHQPFNTRNRALDMSESWLIHVCVMTYPFIHSSVCVPWLHIYDITRWCVSHDVFMRIISPSTPVTVPLKFQSRDSSMCVSWFTHPSISVTLLHIYDITRWYVCRDVFICIMTFSNVSWRFHMYHQPFNTRAGAFDISEGASWSIHVCDVPHPYVWHDSSMCVTWLHLCWYVSHVRQVSFVWSHTWLWKSRVMWRSESSHVNVCHMWQRQVTHEWVNEWDVWMSVNVCHMWQIQVAHEWVNEWDLYVLVCKSRVARLIYISDLVRQSRMRHDSFTLACKSCVFRDSSTWVTWDFNHEWDTTHLVCKPRVTRLIHIWVTWYVSHEWDTTHVSHVWFVTHSHQWLGM